MAETVAFIVNGQEVAVPLAPSRSLLAILRRELGLTGAKEGCAANLCGACTVIVDGRAMNACHVRVEDLAGRRVETIEGLGTPENLHPLQRAFLEVGGSQCGYCTPGMIMSAKALLDRNPRPTRAEILQALKGNLCRCTGYQQIVEAVERAAGIDPAGREPLRTVQLDESGSSTCQEPFLVGRSLPQVTALEKVTGRARFLADLQDMPGQLWVQAVRSAYAHAEILGIDTGEAERYPGVVRVLTHADVPGPNLYGKVVVDQPVLAKDRVRCYADAVALVVAESQEAARAAAELVRVDYRPLPGVFSPQEALRADAPVIPDRQLVSHRGKYSAQLITADDGPLPPHDNILYHLPIRKGDVEKGFAEADLIIENTYRTQHVDHGVLECEAALAYYDADGKLTVVSRGQHVYFERLNIIRALGLPKEDVRVIQPAVGGAFGQGEDIYAQIHVALATLVTKRPCKAVYTREETMLATQKRHPMTITLKTGVTRDGRITALQGLIISDTGAYVSWGENVARKAASHLSGPYEIENIKIDSYAVFTNNLFCGAMRGYGVPQAAFACESQMDEVAKALGMDQLDFRLRNALRAGSRTATQQELPRAFAAPTMQAAAAEFGWRDYHPAREGRKVRGRGMAGIWYGNGFGYGIPDEGDAIVELHLDGGASCWISSLDYGQGSNTVMTQIIGETLGLTPERVRLVTGDTDRTPNCGSTVATRVTFVVGNAVYRAAARIRQDLVVVAARRLGCPPEAVVLRENRAWAAGRPAEAVSIAELAREMEERGLPRRREGIFKAQQFTGRLDPWTGKGNSYWPYSYATQMVEVEVDLDTGKVKVLRAVAAQYAGRAINPQAVRGQVLGGLSMSMGYALSEDMQIREGRPGALNFDRYRMVRAHEMPEVTTVIVEYPEPHGPYGAVGVGETTTVAGAPAILNAIADATGVRLRELPATPARVLAALREEARR